MMARRSLRRRYGRAHDSWAQRTKFDRLRGQIERLAIGSKLELAPNGYVKRHERAGYSLNDRNNTDRNRWGNLEEITGDALYYEENGHLPPPLGSRW